LQRVMGLQPCLPQADGINATDRAPRRTRHDRPPRGYLATFTYWPLTTLRMALAPAPSRTSFMVISPATPGKPFRPARQPRILSRSDSRSAELLVTPDFSMQYL